MHIEEVTHEIMEIVKWYNMCPMDYSGINELMYNMVQLSTLLFFYAGELGEIRKQWKRAEAQTEIVRRSQTKIYLDAGQPNTKAIEYGKICSLDEYAEEKTLDGLYNSMRFFYDSTIEVLNTINQHIANLKKEYETVKMGD